MLVQDVFSFLDELAPFSYAMDFDNSGLLAGDPSQPVQKILVALDCTDSVVKKAQEIGADGYSNDANEAVELCRRLMA